MNNPNVQIFTTYPAGTVAGSMWNGGTPLALLRYLMFEISEDGMRAGWLSGLEESIPALVYDLLAGADESAAWHNRVVPRGEAQLMAGLALIAGSWVDMEGMPYQPKAKYGDRLPTAEDARRAVAPVTLGCEAESIPAKNNIPMSSLLLDVIMGESGQWSLSRRASEDYLEVEKQDGTYAIEIYRRTVKMTAYDSLLIDGYSPAELRELGQCLIRIADMEAAT